MGILLPELTGISASSRHESLQIKGVFACRDRQAHWNPRKLPLATGRLRSVRYGEAAGYGMGPNRATPVIDQSLFAFGIQKSVSSIHEDNARHQRPVARRRQDACGAAAHHSDSLDRGGAAAAPSNSGGTAARQTPPCSFQRARRPGDRRRSAEQQSDVGGIGR